MDIDNFLDKETQEEEVVKEEDQGNQETETFEELTDENKEIDTSEPEEDSFGKKHLELWNKVLDKELIWDAELYANASNHFKILREDANKLKPRLDQDVMAMEKLIDKANNILDSGNHQEALIMYEQITKLKDKIPNIFFQHRAEVHNKIAKLYEQIQREIDSKFVRDAENKMEKIRSLIKDAFSNTNLRNIVEAEKRYSEAISLYKDIPVGFMLQSADLGTDLLRLYKELSIHTQIENLQNELNSIAENKIGKEDNRISRLADITKTKNGSRKKSSISSLQSITDKHSLKGNLLGKLILRKIERAKISIDKGFYVDAERDLQSILRLDPENKKAKQLLETLKKPA
ncbi:hypothetical protein ISS07_03775 [Candidatus Woesearchaeota archaeon]|nr:hypothetical protein [Candidatus Woesearchaeota archaeon]